MVERQIVARGVKDPRVIEAMKSVPRDAFVPENLKHRVFEDHPLPIGEGQTISQPYIVAYMSEHLGLKGTEKVLEIGTGCGYQTAVLSKLAKEVYSIEIVESLAKEAKIRLSQLGYSNVHCKQGDGYFGWKDKAPFDAIILTAAAPEIPEHLLEQLGMHGNMILPVESYIQQIIRVTKTPTGTNMQVLLPVSFVRMTGKIEK